VLSLWGLAFRKRTGPQPDDLTRIPKIMKCFSFWGLLGLTTIAHAVGHQLEKREAFPSTEVCQVYITSTLYETATQTISSPASGGNNVATYTSTVEVTSSVTVSVTAAPLPVSLAIRKTQDYIHRTHRIENSHLQRVAPTNYSEDPHAYLELHWSFGIGIIPSVRLDLSCRCNTTASSVEEF
jgi:hypothetical protein